MGIDERVEAALRVPDRVEALRSFVHNLFTSGYDQSAVLDLLEGVRQELRTAAREEDEDTVLDVMDAVVGWCSPHTKLQGEETARTEGSNGQPILPRP